MLEIQKAENEVTAERRAERIWHQRRNIPRLFAGEHKSCGVQPPSNTSPRPSSTSARWRKMTRRGAASSNLSSLLEEQRSLETMAPIKYLMFTKSPPKMVSLFVISVKSPQKDVGGGGIESESQRSRFAGSLGLFFSQNLIKYNTTVVITLLWWCWSVYLVQRISYSTACFLITMLNAKPHTSRKFLGFIRRGTKPGRNYILSESLFCTHTTGGGGVTKPAVQG